MPEVTEQQKQRFLHLCRLGVDRIEAARATGEQASTYQILSLEDPEFQNEMKKAMNECWRKRRVDGAAEMTQEARKEFLELIREGKHPKEAAQAVGGYYWQFSRLWNVTGYYYDPDFHRAYMDALEEGHPAFLDRIQDLQIRAAENGEYRAIRDLIIMYHPRGEKLAAKKIEVKDADRDALVQALLSIPRDQLSDEEVSLMIQIAEKAAGKPQLQLVPGDGR